MTLLRRNLPHGGKQTFEAVGTSVVMIEGPESCTARFGWRGDKGGEKVILHRGAPIQCAQEFERIELTAAPTPWASGQYRVLLSIGSGRSAPSPFGDLPRAHYTGAVYTGITSGWQMIAMLSNRSGQPTEVVAEISLCQPAATFNQPIQLQRATNAAGSWTPGGWVAMNTASMPPLDRVSDPSKNSICRLVSARLVAAIPFTKTGANLLWTGVAGQGANRWEAGRYQLAPGESIFVHPVAISVSVYAAFDWTEHDPGYAIQ